MVGAYWQRPAAYLDPAECTKRPPYADDIQREPGRPVFDIVSLVTMIHGALAAAVPPRSI